MLIRLNEQLGEEFLITTNCRARAVALQGIVLSAIMRVRTEALMHGLVASWRGR